jgi:NAD(P)-dependent dehydrogenase (short-subunit alcohol dehydrogenase family)
MNISLQAKTAFVCGSSQGIGFAFGNGKTLN